MIPSGRSFSCLGKTREGRIEHQDENLFPRSPLPLPGSVESGWGQGLGGGDVELGDLSSEDTRKVSATDLIALTRTYERTTHSFKSREYVPTVVVEERGAVQKGVKPSAP